MSPIVLLAGAGLAAILLFGKKKTAPAPGETQAPTGPTAEDVYAAAMAPSEQDLGRLAQAEEQLRAMGRDDLAGGVASKIGSIQAATAAKAAQQHAAEQAKADWEQSNGGAPSQANLENLWSSVASGTVTDPGQLTFAWTMFETYGTPARAAAVAAMIVNVKAGRGPLEGPPVQQATTPAETPATTPAEDTGRVYAGGSPTYQETPTARTTPAAGTPAAGTPAAGTPAAGAPSPVQEEETTPEADPDGTVALARAMISVEDTSGWRDKLKSDITAWQSRKGLKADGLFGPKSALKMAEDVGVLPLVRYWSKTGGTLATQLGKYRDDLSTLAANLDDLGDHEHAIALRASADHEKGQGYPKTPAPVPVQTRQEQANTIAQNIALLPLPYTNPSEAAGGAWQGAEGTLGTGSSATPGTPTPVSQMTPEEYARTFPQLQK